MAHAILPIACVVLAAGLAAAFAGGGVLAQERSQAAAAADRERLIVLARVSQNPKADVPRLERMVNVIARRLEPLGIVGGRALIAKNNQELARRLGDGSVDLVSQTPFSALLLAERTGAEILLHEWKGGSAQYRTVFFTRRGGGIAALADLEGRKIAFEDRGSTSAFLLPLAVLKQNGLETTELASPRNPAPAGRIGYAFAASEMNIATWVVQGLVDAGAFSDLDWNDLIKLPATVKQDLVIFHESRPILRSLLLARRDLRPELKAKVKEVLLAMHDDAEGREALKAFYDVRRYGEIAGDSAAALEEARRLLAFLREAVALE